MSSLVFLVPISLVLLGLAITAFVWAVRRGQFDDLETPAVQILVDEPTARHTRPEGASSDAADGPGIPPAAPAGRASPHARTGPPAAGDR